MKSKSIGKGKFDATKCRECGAPKRLHPITEPVRKREGFLHCCMLDYTKRVPTPLPFELRPLNADDKLEIQQYLSE